MHKHILIDREVRFGQPQDSVLFITKNPYIWIEGFIHRNEIATMGNPVDDEKWDMWNPEIIKAFDILDKETESFKLGSLARLYKVFNQIWLSREFVKEPVFQLKYEDFLCLNKAKKAIESLSYKLKGNLKLPDKPVRWSPNFTEEDFTYYIKETPTHLSGGEISSINRIIGEDFIKSLGYKVLK